MCGLELESISNEIPVNAKVREALVKELYAQSRVGRLAGVASAVILVAGLWQDVSHVRLFVWLAIYLGVQVPRSVLARAFEKKSPTGEGVRAWETWFILTASLTAILWGLTAVFLFPHNSLLHQFLLVFFVTVLSAAVAVGYSVSKKCTVICISSLLLPFSGRLIYEGSQVDFVLAAMIFLFGAVLISAILHMHSSMKTSLSLRFEKDGLIRSLDKEKKAVEQANQSLTSEIEQRMLAEHDLAESEKLFRTLVETTSDVVWILDLNLRFTYVSPSVERQLGYSVDEIMSMNPLDTLSPVSRERVLRAFEEELVLETAGRMERYTTRTEEIEQYRKDGSSVWMEINTSFIRDRENRPKGILGISRNMTYRKVAEEALRESERHYRTLFESAPLAVCLATPQGEIIECNARTRQMTGYSERELRELHWNVWYKNRADLNSLMTQLKTEATVEGFEAELKRKDGTTYWASLTVTPIIVGGNRLLLAMVHDCTERKRAEEALKKARDGLEDQVRKRTKELLAQKDILEREVEERKKAELELRESEQRFRAVFETAQDCIFIKDRDLKYTHVNPAMLELFEAKHSDVVGKTDRHLFGEVLAERMEHEDRRVLNGQSLESEHTVIIDNREITFSNVKVPLLNRGGESIGLMGIKRDITERRKQTGLRSSESYQFRSRAMQITMEFALLAARAESTVLLLGESGSGKDYVARYIHDKSQRATGPFFTINCAALTPELAESELFGHEAGSFTGAKGRKRGLLELAEGGTLLLNEIGELSLPLQAKLLTFLDSHSFTRVGGQSTITIDTRLIAATNRDLQKEVETGRFRKDLFYRLNVLSIKAPPLRDRLEDLPALCEAIIAEIVEKLGLKSVPLMDSRCLDVLADYHWPGNVRELKNILERAVILSQGGKIVPRLLARLKVMETHGQPDDWSFLVRFPESGTLNDVTTKVKRELVEEALRRSSGVRRQAAKLLGISRDALKHHIKALALD